MLSDGIRGVGCGGRAGWVCGLKGRSREGMASLQLHASGGHPKVMPRCEVNDLRPSVKRNAHPGGGERMLAADWAWQGPLEATARSCLIFIFLLLFFLSARRVPVQIHAVKCVSSLPSHFQIHLSAVKRLILLHPTKF